MIKVGAETRDKIGIDMIVDMDFAQDDLERPNWSRYLQYCLNFKINRLKQMTEDRSVHSVNFLQRNLKHQRKILGPSKMDFIEAGLTLKKEDFDDHIKERLHLPLKYFFTSLLFDCLVLVFIDPLCLNQKPIINYST